VVQSLRSKSITRRYTTLTDHPFSQEKIVRTTKSLNLTYKQMQNWSRDMVTKTWLCTGAPIGMIFVPSVAGNQSFKEFKQEAVDMAKWSERIASNHISIRHGLERSERFYC
jgi:hypothetical protein